MVVLAAALLYLLFFFSSFSLDKRASKQVRRNLLYSIGVFFFFLSLVSLPPFEARSGK
ncbi:hypothetical protein V8F06_003678 [Rhypophila decipiens]